MSHTLASLDHWYKHAFEELGWMVLAKPEKITHYMTSLDHLLKALELKQTKVQNSDIKEDLKIMTDNVKTLIEFTQQMKPVESLRSKEKQLLKRSEELEPIKMPSRREEPGPRRQLPELSRSPMPRKNMQELSRSPSKSRSSSIFTED